MISSLSINSYITLLGKKLLSLNKLLTFFLNCFQQNVVQIENDPSQQAAGVSGNKFHTANPDIGFRS